MDRQADRCVCARGRTDTHIHTRMQTYRKNTTHMHMSQSACTLVHSHTQSVHDEVAIVIIVLEAGNLDHMHVCLVVRHSMAPDHAKSAVECCVVMRGQCSEMWCGAVWCNTVQ